MTGWESFAHLERMEQMEQRAYALADNHFELRRELVRMRLASGMTQKDVADFLGIQPQAVAKYERYDWDPRLSTLERYANAVGAVIVTQVSKDDGQLTEASQPQPAAIPTPPGTCWHQPITRGTASARVDWATPNLAVTVTAIHSKQSDFATAA